MSHQIERFPSQSLVQMQRKQLMENVSNAEIILGEMLTLRYQFLAIELQECFHFHILEI